MTCDMQDLHHCHGTVRELARPVICGDRTSVQLSNNAAAQHLRYIFANPLHLCILCQAQMQCDPVVAVIETLPLEEHGHHSRGV